MERSGLPSLDTTAVVDTPERVQFRYRLAGPARRAVAWLMDAILKFVIIFVAVMVLGLGGLFLGVAVGEIALATQGLLLLVLFAVSWFYGVFFETLLAGRTPGKMLLSLRVVAQDGGPGDFRAYLLRNLLLVADALPVLFGAAVVTMACDSRFRRLGDLVAGTVVVVEERSKVLGDVVIDPPISEEERQSLPPAVPLSREERKAIEGWIRRRPLLGRERAEELAGLLGPRVTARTGVQAPTWSRVLQLAYARAVGAET